MRLLNFTLAAFLLVSVSQTAQACTGGAVYLNSARFETEAAITVPAGKSCIFNINNIPGALEEVQIVQKPKVGRAGVAKLQTVLYRQAGLYRT